jgi:hypothetical protein
VYGPSLWLISGSGSPAFNTALRTARSRPLRVVPTTSLASRASSSSCVTSLSTSASLAARSTSVSGRSLSVRIGVVTGKPWRRVVGRLVVWWNTRPGRLRGLRFLVVTSTNGGIEGRRAGHGRRSGGSARCRGRQPPGLHAVVDRLGGGSARGAACGRRPRPAGSRTRRSAPPRRHLHIDGDYCRRCATRARAWADCAARERPRARTQRTRHTSRAQPRRTNPPPQCPPYSNRCCCKASGSP